MKYVIEMNCAFVKEYKSLKKALNWVFAKAKTGRGNEYPDCLTVWKIENHQRICLLSNYI